MRKGMRFAFAGQAKEIRGCQAQTIAEEQGKSL